MLESAQVLLKSIGRWFWMYTHTAPQILGNREIHFHTKSASIREALKGGYDIMTRILFFNTVLSKRAASQHRLSSEAQSTSCS